MVSLNGSLNFEITVGPLFKFEVRLEIPLETTINLIENNEPTQPGGSDINVQFVMHTTIGFLRDVSAVNGEPAQMNVRVEGAEPFPLELPNEP